MMLDMSAVTETMTMETIGPNDDNGKPRYSDEFDIEREVKSTVPIVIVLIILARLANLLCKIFISPNYNKNNYELGQMSSPGNMDLSEVSVSGESVDCLKPTENSGSLDIGKSNVWNSGIYSEFHRGNFGIISHRKSWGGKIFEKDEFVVKREDRKSRRVSFNLRVRVRTYSVSKPMLPIITASRRRESL